VRDSWKHFLEKETRVFGINGQSDSSHAKFKEKYQFPFPLLVDSGKRVCKAYNTYGLLMVTRTVYLIGKDGKIRFAKRGMPAPSEVLAAAE
jgi:thioredoxin-dependent peroxiredoxin